MARIGIDKAEVLSARDRLLALGRRPSIDAIRGELGDTGSKTTIHRYLKEIEAEEGGRAGSITASEAILDLSSRLAERLHAEAAQQITLLAEKHQAEITELRGQITSLRNEVASARTQAERLDAELTTEKTAHATAQELLRQEALKNASLTQRALDMETQQTQWQEYRLSLEEKHRHAREALEQFISAAQAQREQEARQHEQQIQFLQGELRKAQNALDSRQLELNASQRGNAELAGELKQARLEWLKLDGEIRILRAAKEQLAAAELRAEHLQMELDKAGERETKLAADNKQKTKELRESQNQRQQLETDLTAAKAIIAVQESLFVKLTLLDSVH